MARYLEARHYGPPASLDRQSDRPRHGRVADRHCVPESGTGWTSQTTGPAPTQSDRRWPPDPRPGHGRPLRPAAAPDRTGSSRSPPRARRRAVDDDDGRPADRRLGASLDQARELDSAEHRAVLEHRLGGVAVEQRDRAETSGRAAEGSPGGPSPRPPPARRLPTCRGPSPAAASRARPAPRRRRAGRRWRRCPR